MPNKDARKSIFPRSKSDRIQLLGIAGFVLGGILVVAVSFHIKQAAQLARDQYSASSAGTIEDTRTDLVSDSAGMYGGHMLYDVQVLVVFTLNGSRQERWITVDQPPKMLASLRYEEAQWKGTQCIVRWNPSNLNQVAVTLRGFPELR